MSSIPESHVDLLERPVLAMLATVQPDGQPQVSPVWVDLDNGHVRVNTAAGRQKWKNMIERPLATITVSDPENPQRYIEVRGRIARHTERNGDEVIDKLAADYLGATSYPYRNPAETRVTFYIEPTRVVAYG
jgi:PPOX class probable F420-dependent enzyme